MPSNSTRNTLARQWELLKLIPGRQAGAGMTAKHLAQALGDLGFDVSERQVQRDLRDLTESFPALECNDTGNPYGWRWARNASIDLPGVSIPEALSLHLIAETLRPLVPGAILSAVESRFRQAATKLKGQTKHHAYARWPDKVRAIPPALRFIPPVIDPEVLENIQNALLKDVQIDCRYQGMDSTEAREYTLHPLALVQRGAVMYLVATVFDYQDIRMFALHRFTASTATGRRARAPDGFDLDDYIRRGAFEFESGKILKLKAKLESTLARILGETPLAQDQKIIAGKDGHRAVLAATLQDSWQLRWWILSQGDQIEITGPAWYRREIAETCRSMANLYSSDPD